MTQEVITIRQSVGRAYLELTKPRITTMVMVTAAIGLLLGNGGIPPVGLFAALMAGTALTSGGAAVLNHFFEREIDARMERTRNRPLPTGVIEPSHALQFGVLLCMAGLVILVWQVNLLTAFLALLTIFLYVVVYTPMKRWSWANTIVGAIPGALPPMGGWAAATGTVGVEAWGLFAILFLWQQPHFYAIAWMFRHDYRRGGLRMLPVVEPDGKSTFRQIIFCSLLLLPASILPTVTGLTGPLYMVGALILGVAFTWSGVILGKTGSFNDARRVLRASIIYLPLLLALIILDFSL